MFVSCSSAGFTETLSVHTLLTEMGRIHLKVLSVLPVTAVIYIHVSVCVCVAPQTPALRAPSSGSAAGGESL